MKELIKYIVFPIAFIFGILNFLISGKTSKIYYQSFRFLFVITNGRINDLFSKMISLFIPKYKISSAVGVLGELSELDINRIVSDIESNGFHVFKNKLEQDRIDHIYKFASETKVSYLDFNQKNIAYSTEKVIFSENSGLSPRFQFTNQELFENESLKKIIFDRSLLAIANSYLKTKPILDLAVMWWSVPFDSVAENKAAQMFHFDMDRFKFIKFFFYINDVNTDNGPHCYVRASHKGLPKEMLQDRRITDDEIRKNYDDKDILELVGGKGSIIAVDTRGLHKGKPLISGKRLLFQIEFTNSLFGAPYNIIESNGLPDEYKTKKMEYKRAYQLINNG